MVAKHEQTTETPLARALSLRHKAPPKAFDPVGADVCCYFFEPKDVFSEAAILLPDTAKDRFNTTMALVIAAGPRCEYTREGDIILVKGGEFSDRLGAPVKYGQSTIGYAGYKYQVFPEYMVAGILYREGKGWTVTKCKSCDGTGKQANLTCIACDGKGEVTEEQAAVQEAAERGFYGPGGKPNAGKDRGADAPPAAGT